MVSPPTRSLNLHNSSKVLGKYEKELIKKLVYYFNEKGYETYPHVRLNIAWSNGLSDVDILLYKEGIIVAIEVKSKKDKLDALYNQFFRISDYVDYFYLATNKKINVLNSKEIGIINIGKKIKIIKDAEKLIKPPKKSSLFALKKICLMKMSGIKDDKKLKSRIIDIIINNMDERLIKSIIKEIALCTNSNHFDCPILKYIPAFESSQKIQLDNFFMK